MEKKINEIKEVKSEVFNLRRQIESNERRLPDQENQMKGREPTERQNLLDWEKNRQERKERLIEGQRSLNQREEYLNISMKQIEKELQDDKKKIEKDHATLKEKEDRYQRMVALVSSKEDATKEKYIINKEEEESTCLT